MKYIFFSIFSIYLFLRSYVIVPCDVFRIKQAITPILFFEQKIDGPLQSPILTGLLHSKFSVGVSQFGRCYFGNIDPAYVFEFLGILGFIFLLIFIYEIIDKKNYYLIFAFLALPLVTILEPNSSAFIIGAKMFAIIGLGYFLKIDIKKFVKFK